MRPIDEYRASLRRFRNLEANYRKASGHRLLERLREELDAMWDNLSPADRQTVAKEEKRAR